MSGRIALAAGIVVERVGNDVLVFVPNRDEAAKLSGEVADTVLRIHSGEGVDCRDSVVKELSRRGIVDLSGLSRRGLLKAGAVGAGAGMAVLAMPSVAAASSLAGLRGEYANENTASSNIEFRLPFPDPAVFPSGSAGNTLRLSISSLNFVSTQITTFGPEYRWEVSGTSSVSSTLGGVLELLDGSTILATANVIFTPGNFPTAFTQGTPSVIG